MALPSNWSTGWIKGKYIDMNGTPIVGEIIATVDVTRLVDQAQATVILPSPLRQPLDVDGYFELELPATDDPDVNPTNFTYTITESWAGGQRYSIPVPAGTVDDAILTTTVVAVSASTGIVSLKGDKGDPGDIAQRFEYHQATASSVWTIDHNQDRYPPEPTILVGGVSIKTRIEMPTRNRIIARFNAPVGPGDLYF